MSGGQVKLKPEAKKVEMKVPIDHGPGLVNFDDDADDAIQLEDLTLSSTHVSLNQIGWVDACCVL